jgi:glycosyltransferase involved in cell wall biosynthesis
LRRGEGPPLKVTVLIAAWNAESCVAAAIQSALQQTLPAREREVLVVNDGSTDGTLAVLRGFGGEIAVLDRHHEGLSAACNAGLAAARGRAFVRLDADDWLERDALAVMTERLDADPSIGCVYSDRLEVSPGGRTRIVSLAKFNVFRTIACGILFQTDLARAVGGYDDLLFEEYDFLMRY